jgi:hypothetical protein
MIPPTWVLLLAWLIGIMWWSWFLLQDERDHRALTFALAVSIIFLALFLRLG